MDTSELGPKMNRHLHLVHLSNNGAQSCNEIVAADWYYFLLDIPLLKILFKMNERREHKGEHYMLF